MSLDEALQRTGGRWVKLDDVGDQIVGVLLHIDTKKNRTDPQGNPVPSKKTGEPRKVFGLLVQTELREDGNDDGKRRFDANESAQYAILDAFKEWRKTNPDGDPDGCEFYLRVAEDRPGSWDQLKYKAKFGKRVMDTSTVSAAATSGPVPDEEPF